MLDSGLGSAKLGGFLHLQDELRHDSQRKRCHSTADGGSALIPEKAVCFASRSCETSSSSGSEKNLLPGDNKRIGDLGSKRSLFNHRIQLAEVKDREAKKILNQRMFDCLLSGDGEGFKQYINLGADINSLRDGYTPLEHLCFDIFVKSDLIFFLLQKDPLIDFVLFKSCMDEFLSYTTRDVVYETLEVLIKELICSLKRQEWRFVDGSHHGKVSSILQDSLSGVLQGNVKFNVQMAAELIFSGMLDVETIYKTIVEFACNPSNSIIGWTEGRNAEYQRSIVELIMQHQSLIRRLQEDCQSNYARYFNIFWKYADKNEVCVVLSGLPENYLQEIYKERSYTPLHIAGWAGNYDACRQLIRAGFPLGKEGRNSFDCGSHRQLLSKLCEACEVKYTEGESSEDLLTKLERYQRLACAPQLLQVYCIRTLWQWDDYLSGDLKTFVGRKIAPGLQERIKEQIKEMKTGYLPYPKYNASDSGAA